MLNSLLINTYDYGGAAKACLRLHKGLLRHNIKSKVLVKKKTYHDLPEVYQITIKELKSSIKDKIRRRAIKFLMSIKFYEDKQTKFIKNRHPNLELFSYPFSEYDITKSALYQEADIINLHWVANFLDYPTFFKKNTKPIIWTLHDENPFSGGEHYKEEIIGINDNGYPIYRNITKKEKQVFKKILEIKKQALDGIDNLTIVTPSMWLAERARKSELFNRFKILTIYNSVEQEIYKPVNKELARKRLNIPNNKKVILFVSHFISNFRKGFAFLIKAFDYIQRDDIYFMSVGVTEKTVEQNNFHQLGFINDENMMSIIYSAADIFVLPSLMDNLPNTMLESIMCGTPVVAFPVGGIQEVIKPGFNGILADEISARALAIAINNALDNLHLFDREKIRNEAETKFNLDVQAKMYIELYKQILKKKTL